MLFNILECFFYPLFAIIKAFGKVLITLLPAIKQLNNIAGSFSWISILAGFLGVSATILLILKFVIKLSLK